MRTSNFAVVSLVALALSTSVCAAPVFFEVGGNTAPSSIQGTVDNFRTALGNPNNGNAAGPLGSGRREINWDGGGVDTTSPGGTPFDVFLQNRGARFTTAGTGFVQAPEAGGANGGLETFFTNPTYGTTFNTFSSPRLFTPVGSNVLDGFFFIPGSSGLAPATVGGFGAVFTDVDLANSTTLSFFDIGNNLLTTRSVLPGTVADGSLSFLGIIFNAGERIARVRITSGTTALGAGINDNPGAGVDLVVMDDFLFREPAGLVSEPSTWALVGVAGLALLAGRRRQRALSS